MLDGILKEIIRYNSFLDKEKMEEDFEYIVEAYRNSDLDLKVSCDIVRLLLPFRPDEAGVLATLIYPLYKNEYLKGLDIKRRFGQEVCTLLLGLVKLENLNYAKNDRSSQVEVFRKMFMAMAKDMRVIIIGLAQRLFVMKNLDEFIDAKVRKLIANETLNVYVPIATRLGMYNMKIQLEDLSFKYLNPEDYGDISTQLMEFSKVSKLSITKVKEDLEEFFDSRGIDVEVFGRIKSVYSIYKKLKRKGLSSVKELYDIFAMRVILDSKFNKDSDELVEGLYGALGLLHSRWRPVTRKFKDYIAVPKPNGYRSLHTVVLGLAPKNMEQPVEVQIRSAEMHREAQYGIASHWLYKHSVGGGHSNGDTVNSQVDWLRGLRELHGYLGSEYSVMKEVELDIFRDRIFVLTPRGEVKDLPAGACPIDFAYYIHTDVGHECLMAKVNGNLVPLNHELKNGDMVDIITKKGNRPKLQWLSIVKTGLARNKVKNWFGTLNKDANVKEGKKLVNDQLLKHGRPLLDQNYSILKNYLDGKLNLSDREHVLEEIGKGAQMASDIVGKLFPKDRLSLIQSSVKPRTKHKKINKGVNDIESRILIGGESDLPVRIAGCCRPKRGQEIIAYITRGNTVTIHSSMCFLLEKLDEERFMTASWKSGRAL